ncbi:unnamed protein product [uncultured bacterium]|nr:unnamed protein product [uncultured bacterium]
MRAVLVGGPFDGTRTELDDGVSMIQYQEERDSKSVITYRLMVRESPNIMAIFEHDPYTRSIASGPNSPDR